VRRDERRVRGVVVRLAHLELHLVIGAGRNIRGEGPRRTRRAERQVDQEGADLDLGAVVVAGGDLAGILLRLVLQLHFPQHQLPVEIRRCRRRRCALGAAERDARGHPGGQGWVARLKLSCESPEGPGPPASLQADASAVAAAAQSA
jgi:hypothetical protein